MGKVSHFMWGWNSYTPLPDKLMTRDRAAKLLRSWRTTLRGRANNKTIIKLERLASHQYVVTHYCGESATLIIGGHP